MFVVCAAKRIFSNLQSLSLYICFDIRVQQLFFFNCAEFCVTSEEPVGQLDADCFPHCIFRYNEVSHTAQKEDTITNISFIMLDSSNLKRSIQDHCKLWQDKFTTLLKEIASEKLNNLTEFFEQHCQKFVPRSIPTFSLDSLVLQYSSELSFVFNPLFDVTFLNQHFSLIIVQRLGETCN